MKVDALLRVDQHGQRHVVVVSLPGQSFNRPSPYVCMVYSAQWGRREWHSAPSIWYTRGGGWERKPRAGTAEGFADLLGDLASQGFEVEVVDRDVHFDARKLLAIRP